jgi:redox-sensitive bicupin YhaK (pirin superfamily)
MKSVIAVEKAPAMHWVGDGFPVRSLFSYHSHGKQLSPFLLLDHAGPAPFPAADRPRGVGQHPHRGFETVTIVYQGEVEHRDSTGSGGIIGPGDVQWMTAGSGILHEEFHSHAFTRTGGTLEMVQLWVNLPARHKMATPGYQAIVADEIPVVQLPDGAGALRVIAGDFAGQHGPAHTFTPLSVWDVSLQRDGHLVTELPQGWTTAVVLLRGTVLINEDTVARDGELITLDRADTQLTIEANDEATLLVLAGEPIDEPIAGHGPFVMNSSAEISAAIRDYQSGRFGELR